MPTLVARTRVKFGSKAGSSGPIGFTVATRGRMIEPGAVFEVDDVQLAKRLISDGAAMTRATALEEARGISNRGEPIPDVYREVAAEAHVAVTPAERLNAAANEARAAGLDVRIEIGQPS